MKCKYCGAQLSENAKFCGVCGNKVEREEIKQDESKSIPNKNQKQKENKDKKVEKGKKGIIPAILLLCVIVAGAGVFYYRNKGGDTKTASTTNKKEIEKSKNNTAKEYEDSANGVWNSYSEYYKGDIYYIGSECLYKKNADTEEIEILYNMGDEAGAYSFFKIFNDSIYLTYTNAELNYNHKVVKLNCNGEEETKFGMGDCNGLYVYGENLYCYVSNYNEETDKCSGYLVKVDKNDNEEIIELSEECMNSETYMFSDKYLYYQTSDNKVNRLDITQGKNAVSENVVDFAQNKEIYAMYVYRNKIYYSTYEDEAGFVVMNEYDMQTGKQTDDIGKKWFGEKYVGFFLENARGDKIYILRYDEDDTDDTHSGMLYSWDLKKEQLEEIEVVDNVSELDVCKGYILYSNMNDGDINYIYRNEMEEESEI